MKRLNLTLLALAAFATTATAALPDFTGEYADRKFMKNTAVLQLSLEQTGKDVSVFFTAGRHDGTGPAPEAEGKGKVSDSGTLNFTFKDNRGNAGSGTITKSGGDVVMSVKTTKVADASATHYYQPNIKLTRQTVKK